METGHDIAIAYLEVITNGRINCDEQDKYNLASGTYDWGIQILSRCGLDGRYSSDVMNVLIHSNLRGVDTHGVIRLIDYAKRLLNTEHKDIEMVRDEETLTLIDGHKSARPGLWGICHEDRHRKSVQTWLRHIHCSRQQPLFHGGLLFSAGGRAGYDRGHYVEWVTPPCTVGRIGTDHRKQPLVVALPGKHFPSRWIWRIRRQQWGESVPVCERGCCLNPAGQRMRRGTQRSTRPKPLKAC